jgi:hypothetical protein
MATNAMVRTRIDRLGNEKRPKSSKKGLSLSDGLTVPIARCA